MNDSTAANDVRALIASLGQLARDASRELARAGTAAKNHALEAAADSLVDREKTILAANARDVKAGEEQGAGARAGARHEQAPERHRHREPERACREAR